MHSVPEGMLTRIPRKRPTMAAPKRTVAMIGTIQWIVTGTAVHANLPISTILDRDGRDLHEKTGW